MRMMRPESLSEALALMAAPGEAVTPLAGATDLYVGWHEQATRASTLLDLTLLSDELSPCTLMPDRLRLGALTTFWDVIRRDDVAEAFPLLRQAARSVGATQIQTRGTWAGNVGNGSPAADGVLALLAYGAEIVLQSSDSKRAVPLAQYYTGYRQSVRQANELIVSIDLPRRDRKREWFHKVGTRRAQAITKVGVAIVQDDAGWRVAANSVAPVVRRCTALEQALEAGQRFADPRQVEQVLTQDISPIDDIRSTAQYRRRVLGRLIYYWLVEAGLAA